MGRVSGEGDRLIRDLATVGVRVRSVYDLVNTSEPYPAAIPVLVSLLKEGVQDDRVAEGIVRALGVKEARGVAARPLLDAFRQAPSDRWSYKWAIGNSLLVAADKSVVDDIIRLVGDKSHGRSREMLVITLGRFRSPQTTQVLIDLLDDPEVAAHAARALGRHRAHEARPALTRVAEGGATPLVRREATSALRKLTAE